MLSIVLSAAVLALGQHPGRTVPPAPLSAAELLALTCYVKSAWPDTRQALARGAAPLLSVAGHDVGPLPDAARCPAHPAWPAGRIREFRFLRPGTDTERAFGAKAHNGIIIVELAH